MTDVRDTIKTCDKWAKKVRKITDDWDDLRCYRDEKEERETRRFEARRLLEMAPLHASVWANHEWMLLQDQLIYNGEHL